VKYPKEAFEEMKGRKEGPRSMKAQSDALSVRATISFPPALYETLEDIAKQKKVSLAWVVRDAAEKYIAHIPRLFSGTTER
jgi:hypothetical protein